MAVLVVVGVALAAGCGSSGGSGDRHTIVVTTPILGSLVKDLAGADADVRVLMPNGADPHEYQPSAKDVARIGAADLLVENGLNLEEGLHDALAQARGGGTPFFTASDHVTLRTVGAQEASDAHGRQDPHVWMDPIAMRGVVAALAPVLHDRLGLNVTARAAALEARLIRLNAEVARTLAVIPRDRRRLVTGHESMGYFADRYGFRLVGALIPSLSSQAQVSASNLAALRALVQKERVPAIFNEAGTPSGVAAAIGGETGARVIEVATHALPADGSYVTFMRDVAAAVVDGLGPRAGH